MSDLRDWLRRNNLEQYAEAFEANDIDLDILSDLSEGDLEELGLSLGNRRRLMKAIAAPPADPTPRAAVVEPTGEAERRQVTVLFCDLVGSTSLSNSIDPELLGELIRRYQNAAAGAVGRFGGFVAKFMGDGILAYFGFPTAFEDAAERAVRAAIGILTETVAIARPDGASLQARIGIATGLVVVGELIGTGSAQERTIVGETPNLAARLQALAEPDTILISETTQLLIGGLFELEHTGEHELKGFPRPVPAWRVLCEAVVESRFAAIRTRGGAPLVGRTHEIGMMFDRWRLARHGEGQIITVIGEGGMGKSRLVEALHERIAGEPYARIHLQCSPYHSESALHPIIEHVGRAARFAAADPPEVRREKLRQLFATQEVDETAIPLLAELMSVAGSIPPESMTPAQRKAATISLLIDSITHLGDAEPVLLVLEDAHWIDATTLELMTRLVDSIGHSRLLALVTARPDFAPPWGARPHATLLTINRLSRAECTELVEGVAASHDLSAQTIAAIIAKTDGVPLFVEELTKSVLEQAEGSVAVPATLKDSLMARLDRLGEAREVAQIASVIGRQFSVALVDAVSGRSGAELEAALGKLVEAGIVFPEGRGSEQSFNFKHALVRDAAYESLLLGRRREWHARVARALESRFPETATNEPELVAHHFGEAGLIAPACDYRMKAGDRAVSRSAYSEAVAHFSAGLKLAETPPVSAEQTRSQLDFLLKLIPAQMVAGGMQSVEAEETCHRASAIAEAIGDEKATFKAKWGLWLNANIRRKTGLARERGGELLTLAQRSGDGDLLLEAYHCLWSTAFFRGDVAATLDHGRIGLETYDMSRHRHIGHAFGGHDPGVCAHVCGAVLLQTIGDTASAKVSMARALELAECLDHPNTLAHALHNLTIARQIGRDRAGALEAARRACAVAEKFGLTVWRPGSLIHAAWAMATGDGIAEAVKLIEAEIDNAAAVSPLPQYYLGLAGEVLLTAGRATSGLAYLDRAIALAGEPGVGFYLPEIYRLRGECLLALSRNNQGEARQAFGSARDIARQQGGTLFQQRAETALSELAS